MPSPLIPPPPRAPTGSHASVESTQERALRIAIEARQLARAAIGQIGRSPDPSDPRDEGEGLLGSVAVIGTPPDPVRGIMATGLMAIVLRLDASVGKLEGALVASAKAEADAVAARARAAWALGIPLVLAVLLGAGALAWAWVSTLHH